MVSRDASVVRDPSVSGIKSVFKNPRASKNIKVSRANMSAETHVYLGICV